MNGIFKAISPSWNIPGVRACTFLAHDTENRPVSFSLNTELGRRCRELLENLVQPTEPIVWLQQVHGASVVELPLDPDEYVSSQPTETENVMPRDVIRPMADASYTFQSGVVCAVLTADCLPIVLAQEGGTAVAAIHAGRRGLEQDILANVVNILGEPECLYAWIGPGISVSSYPVSQEIQEAFLQKNPDMSSAFKASAMGDCCMDLSEIARLQLLNAGILERHINIAVKNTFTDPDLHSARRDGDDSGRMATLVWME
jgi:polyphenol oxidase